jgi:hypothetical protein
MSRRTPSGKSFLVSVIRVFMRWSLHPDRHGPAADLGPRLARRVNRQGCAKAAPATQLDSTWGRIFTIHTTRRLRAVLLCALSAGGSRRMGWLAGKIGAGYSQPVGALNSRSRGGYGVDAGLGPP